ncbi:hypothetical protein Q31b_57630 [Novipirellula aureliae]|uniref:Uncharacterized protein n=1 Tax=Novipirellula aureliae TaxID=2527966 RepID=A0A5C6DE02_9BACT|nr:hypothetical protein [Novipirellula aureliae]TWU33446.1 hypothetical protein Q31b_57630 [Novipirellula aureliae]
MNDTFIEFITSQLTESVPKLASLYGTWATAQRLKRAEDLFERLRRYRGLTFSDFATSDAGFHLLEKVVERVKAEHCEAKREHFANLLVSTWIDNGPHQAVFDEADLFLRAIDRFTDVHLYLLAILHEADVKASIPFRKLQESVEDATADCDRRGITLVALNDLCAVFAMVNRSWDLNRKKESRPMFSGSLSPENISRKCYHAITQRGIRFVDRVVREPIVAAGGHPS